MTEKSTTNAVLELVAAMERAKQTNSTDSPNEVAVEAAKQLGHKVIELMDHAIAANRLTTEQALKTLCGVIGVTVNASLKVDNKLLKFIVLQELFNTAASTLDVGPRDPQSRGPQ